MIYHTQYISCEVYVFFGKFDTFNIVKIVDS